MKREAITTETLTKLRARVQRSHVAGDKWLVVPDPLCQAAADEIEKYVKAWNAVSDKYEALLNQLGATDA